MGFHLRTWSETPGFLRITAALVHLFRRTPGAVRLHFTFRPARRQFVSHSTWLDREAMQAYFRSPEHREAVRSSFAGMCDEYYSVSTAGRPALLPALPRLPVLGPGPPPGRPAPAAGPRCPAGCIPSRSAGDGARAPSTAG